MLKWALLLVTIMLVALQAQAEEIDNELNERSPYYIQAKKNSAGKAWNLKKEKEEELSNIDFDFKKYFLSIKESLMKKHPITDIPKKTTPVYIKPRNVDFKKHPITDIPKKTTPVYIKPRNVDLKKHTITDFPKKTTPVYVKPTMVEKKVLDEPEEGEEPFFSARAMRERASRKTPKKLSLLSKGLRELKVPCETEYEIITVEPGETVRFTSPRYPKKYRKNEYCGWHLMGANWNTRFNITCQKFKVQKRNKNGYCLDYLSLEEEPFCGKKNSDGPNEWSSYDWYNDVIFYFVSNPKKQLKGFSCTATAYTRTSLTNTTYPPPTTICPYTTTYPSVTTYTSTITLGSTTTYPSTITYTSTIPCPTTTCPYTIIYPTFTTYTATFPSSFPATTTYVSTINYTFTVPCTPTITYPPYTTTYPSTITFPTTTITPTFAFPTTTVTPTITHPYTATLTLGTTSPSKTTYSPTITYPTTTLSPTPTYPTLTYSSTATYPESRHQDD